MQPSPRPGRWRPLAAFALVSSLGSVALAGDPPKAKLRMVGHPGQVTEVHLVEGKNDTTLETFGAPQQILGSGISQDGQWAFVWHFAHPPQVVSLYDLGSHQRTVTFEPGFPGDLRWTHGGTLLHTWGCGTSCQMARLYDTKGTVLFAGSAGLHSESPSMRFMITGPATPAANEDIQLVDLQSAQVIAVNKDRAPGTAVVGQRWDEPHHKVEVKLGGGSDASSAKTVVIPLPE
jgi:hypothetical protein